MNRKNRYVFLIVILGQGLCLGASNSLAQSTDFEVDLSIGVEQDGNVTVSDIDLASGLDDIAWLLRAKASVKHQFSTEMSLKGNYLFSAKEYDEFSQFDQNYHLATADLAHKFGKTSVGIVGRYLDASLNGEAYLEAKQLSPYISRYFGREFFARAFYNYSDRTYKFRPERDGKTHAFGVTGYHFLDGTRQFITLGYRNDDVGAFERQLAYDRHQLQADYSHRIPIWQQDSTLKFSLKYESRDYKDINFIILDRREDDRFTYGASWKVPAFSNGYVELDLKFRDYDSNLALVDYKKTVFGVRIGNVF